MDDIVKDLYNNYELNKNSINNIPILEMPKTNFRVNETSLFLYGVSITYTKQNNLDKAIEKANELKVPFIIIRFKDSYCSWLCGIKESNMKSASLIFMLPLEYSLEDSKYYFPSVNEKDFFLIYDSIITYLIEAKKNKIYTNELQLKFDEYTILIKELITNKLYSLAFTYIFLFFASEELKSNITIYSQNLYSTTFSYILENIKKLTISMNIVKDNDVAENVVKDIKEGKNSIEEKFANIKDTLPNEVIVIIEKELSKLSRMNPLVPDYSNQLNYLETAMDLPWNKFSASEIDMKILSKVFNESHYGLDDVKTAILEHIALQNWSKKSYGEVICLIGPPGTGKSSLANIIADSLGRKFIKIALGGVGDESEFRGHRKTYVSSESGRIVKELIKIGEFDPVIVLDEIDKLQTFKGSPQDALLEILDPEQNTHFVDRYLGFPIDLSKCLFICTANYKDQIPAPLLNRMHVIDIAGYSKEEQKKIAIDYLIPKYQRQWNLNCVSIDESIIDKLVIKEKTGMRDIERAVKTIFKKSSLVLQLEDLKEINLDINNCKEKINLDINMFLSTKEIKRGF